MNIEVQRTTKTLDEGDRAGLGRLPGIPRLFDQVCRDTAVAPLDIFDRTVVYSKSW